MWLNKSSPKGGLSSDNGLRHSELNCRLWSKERGHRPQAATIEESGNSQYPNPVWSKIVRYFCVLSVSMYCLCLAAFFHFKHLTSLHYLFSLPTYPQRKKKQKRKGSSVTHRVHRPTSETKKLVTCGLMDNSTSLYKLLFVEKNKGQSY